MINRRGFLDGLSTAPRPPAGAWRRRLSLPPWRRQA